MEKPVKFEQRGTSYVGYAIALLGQGGSEIIIFAPTRDEAEATAEGMGQFRIDRRHIKQAALVGMKTFEKLAAMQPTTGEE